MGFAVPKRRKRVVHSNDKAITLKDIEQMIKNIKEQQIKDSNNTWVYWDKNGLHIIP